MKADTQGRAVPPPFSRLQYNDTCITGIYLEVLCDYAVQKILFNIRAPPLGIPVTSDCEPSAPKQALETQTMSLCTWEPHPLRMLECFPSVGHTGTAT